MTPLERVEALFEELVAHYGEGEDREIRAAAKLLLVALDRFRRFGGPGWQPLVAQYLEIAARRPDKLERMLEANRTPEEALLD